MGSGASISDIVEDKINDTCNQLVSELKNNKSDIKNTFIMSSQSNTIGINLYSSSGSSKNAGNSKSVSIKKDSNGSAKDKLSSSSKDSPISSKKLAQLSNSINDGGNTPILKTKELNDKNLPPILTYQLSSHIATQQSTPQSAATTAKLSMSLSSTDKFPTPRALPNISSQQLAQSPVKTTQLTQSPSKLTIKEAKSIATILPTFQVQTAQENLSPSSFVNSSRENGSSKDKGLKSARSIRQMALYTHSRQENTYIPQDSISLPDSKATILDLPTHLPFTSQPPTTRPGQVKKQLSTVHDSPRDDLTPSGSKHDVLAGVRDEKESKVGSLPPIEIATPPSKKPVPVNISSPQPAMARRPTLAINIQDDQDWIQVADDDDEVNDLLNSMDEGGDHSTDANDNPNGSPKVQRASLSQNFPQQSYLFTKSGTIFVDGFMEGIRKDGIFTITQPENMMSINTECSPVKGAPNCPASTTSMTSSTGSPQKFSHRGSIVNNILSPDGKTIMPLTATMEPNQYIPKIPVNDRLVIICKLGQGACSVVYKALDLISMRLVALKMIPVFERGKRRQMVAELGAMFTMLRNKQNEMLNTWWLDDEDSYTLPSESHPSTPPNQAAIGHTFQSTNDIPNSNFSNTNFLISQSEKPMRSSLSSSQQSSQLSYQQNSKSPGDFIVDFYDAFANIEEGRVALMMEYMNGGSLQDIVDHGGCDDEATLATIAQQALTGLAFLHSCKQLHRDLKPANFLISHSGDVKIADLGIMKQLKEGEDEPVTSNIPTIGNPHARSRSNSVSISYANYLSQTHANTNKETSNTQGEKEGIAGISSPKRGSIVGSVKKPLGIADTDVNDLGLFSPAGQGYQRKGGDTFQNPLLTASSPKGADTVLHPGSLLPGALPPRKKSVSTATIPTTMPSIKKPIQSIQADKANLVSSENNGISPVKPSQTSTSPRSVTKSLPRTHTFVGTATYMSPERIDGKEYSFPGDIWGLGLSIMAVALGKLPFDVSGGYWSLLTAIRDVPLISYLPDSFTDDFRDFLSSCLHRNPDRRLSAFQLLKHPFIKRYLLNSNAGRSRASSLNGTGDLSADNERGRIEFRAILKAIQMHIERMQSQIRNSNTASTATLLTSSAASLPVSSTRVEDDIQRTQFFGDLSSQSVEQIIRRLIFGQPSEGHDNSVQHHRMSVLMDQLSLSEEIAISEANRFLEELANSPRIPRL